MLPTDARARKNIPLFSGCFAYFPDALAGIAEVSKVGNDQHNPGEPLHWAREKSGDEADTLFRHASEAGAFDTDLKLHSVKAAWRALALAQKDIELHSHLTDASRAAWLERHAGVYPYPADRVPSVDANRARLGLDREPTQAVGAQLGSVLSPKEILALAERDLALSRRVDEIHLR